MLPALRLHDSDDEGHTYTRCARWVRPLESLWGMLAKWQLANCLPYAALAASVTARAAVDPAVGVDLRVLEPFDLDALADHSGVPRAALAQGTCCGHADAQVLALASPRLRLCTCCLQQGFHATLFQFTAIARCPIHRRRLQDACPHCRTAIAYRLDAAFAARPFACPHCGHLFLPNPTVLARQRPAAGPHPRLLRWQRFLAHYACWFAGGSHGERDAAGRFVKVEDKAARNAAAARRLAFVGALQERLVEPPPVPWTASSPPASSAAMAQAPRLRQSATSHVVPGYSRSHWPSFHSRRFLALYRRYAAFLDSLRQPGLASRRDVTAWWRRRWEGAFARPCALDQVLSEPPFGIAEWLALAAAAPAPGGTGALPGDLHHQFDHDLAKTWDAWSSVLGHPGTDAHETLDPRLVPPRACWLPGPAFEPGSAALGF